MLTGLLVLVLVLGSLVLGRVARSQRVRLGCVGGLLGVWLVGLAWRIPPFNARDVEMGTLAGWGVVHFPGDAPWADLMLGLGELLSLLAAVLWLVARALRRLLRLRRAWENALAGPILLGFVSTVLATGAISSRHFGEWRELKVLLHRYSDMVEKEVPDRNRSLTHVEHEAIKGRLFTSEPVFVSRGFLKPLEIRMMQGRAPYVGVDFGAGRNAVFDPTTMICTYSD